jgi:hypothetical protein
MRLPTTEPGAFQLAWGLALATGASILIGAALTPIWGVGVFTAVALLVLAWSVLSEDPSRRTDLQRAEEIARARPAARRRVLILANEALMGDRLRDELLSLGEPRPELQVVAPVLLSHTHFLVTDVDRERAEARDRLDETLAWARGQGFAAEGVVGDHVDPLAAIGDELRLHGAERVIVATHPPERENWIEHDMLEHMRRELELPITHIVIDREAVSA